MIALLCVMLAVLAPGSTAASTPTTTLDPDTVLARYAQALKDAPVPKLAVFEYAIEQAGVHDLIQTHRVYRAGREERDETLAVSGKALSPPLVRLFHGRIDRYAVARLAPTEASYAFAFVGTHKSGKHTDYIYRTLAHTPGAFEVTQVTIDGVRFLPSSISFVTGRGKVRGTGTINFNKSDRYWMPVLAVAVANVGQERARERIAFSGYRFPTSLPRSTFAAPRSLATPSPSPPPAR